MQYMLLIYGDEGSSDGRSDEERGQIFQVVELNRAVAVAMAEGPERGLALIDRIDGLGGYRHFHSARAGLLRQLGRNAEAGQAYGRALELVTRPTERLFLERRLAEVRLDP